MYVRVCFASKNACRERSHHRDMYLGYIDTTCRETFY